jgi:hypothetical protein
MSDIVELSTGHVFAKGSVRAVGPTDYGFKVYGIGFTVPVEVSWHAYEEFLNRSQRDMRAYQYDDYVADLRREFIEKLLGLDEIAHHSV